MKRKIFAGGVIRQRREAAGLSQAGFAKRLGISASYLNQIEGNQRSLTAVLLVDVARALRIDVAELSDDGPERLIAHLREMLVDPVFDAAAVGPRELRTLALAAPGLGRAILDLHAVYRRTEEKLRGLDEVIDGGRPDGSAHLPFPFDEVRDFFHGIGNYVDALDRSAEALAGNLWSDAGVTYESLVGYVEGELGTRVSTVSGAASVGIRSRFDPVGRHLVVSRGESPASRKFLLACHIAGTTQRGIIDREIEAGAFRTAAARDVARLALENAFAGALLMPYGRFRAEASRLRHDVELLSDAFGVSFEQVCHRLSTLQRPGHEGVPFYFLRVDRAGNITKRHSATRLQFARYGGACPLWNVHEAFERPEHFLVQVAEMPDGVRYLSVARAITKSGGAFGAVGRHYAIGFGCELTHAGALVYADSLDIRRPAAVARIGTNCRLCERTDCPQRAVPPYEAAIAVETGLRGTLPYGITRPERDLAPPGGTGVGRSRPKPTPAGGGAV